MQFWLKKNKGNISLRGFVVQPPTIPLSLWRQETYPPLSAPDSHFCRTFSSSFSLTQQLHKELRNHFSLETITVQSLANRHASKWGKGLAVLRTRWRLLSGISLPRTHCHTTNGNPRQSWIPFQRNVCERLSRRTVIEGRTGFNERQLTEIRALLSDRQARYCCRSY